MTAKYDTRSPAQLASGVTEGIAIAGAPGLAIGRGITRESIVFRALRDGGWITSTRLSIYPELMLAIYLLATVCFLAGYGAIGPEHQRLGMDYAPFYAATKLAVSGHAAQAYNDAIQRSIEQKTAGYRGTNYEIWDYPPTVVLMVLPFSRLGFNRSLLAWIMVTLAAYLAVLWVIIPNRQALLLAAAFPAAFVNLRDGQDGFISLSLMAGGLLALERRPILAGLLFGLLSYKPHFGILIPIMLVATGRWRAFASATVATLGLVALTTFLFGWDTWLAFFAGIPISSHRLLVAGAIGFGKMQSVFGTARLWRASLTTSWALQAIISLVTVTTVLWIWLGRATFSMKAAALVVGTLLVTPYMVDYDLVLLAAPIAWLSYEGLRAGFLTWEKSLLFLAWISPLLARPLSLSGFPLTPVVLALMLVAIVRRGGTPAAEACAMAGCSEILL